MNVAGAVMLPINMLYSSMGPWVALHVCVRSQGTPGRDTTIGMYNIVGLA